jgi:hypothetical protein
MRKKKMSTVEQDSKSKISENPSGSDNAESADEAKKEGGIERDPKPQKEMKSIDEWVFED